MRRPLPFAARLLALAAVLTATACGGSSSDATAPAGGPTPAPPPPAAAAPPVPAPAPVPALEPARCPAEAGTACVAHTGRVVTVESVDPDGDGDLHVIAAGGSVTAPGITIFDVSKALRPAVDPRPGDRVTGAGPVYRGSFGQRQIEVTVFRVAPARR